MHTGTAFPHAHSTDEFIDLQYEENETKIIRFANYLRMVFQQPIPNADQSILESAAKALGTRLSNLLSAPLTTTSNAHIFFLS